MPAPLKSRLNAPRGHRNDSKEARRVSAVAGNSQKPLKSRSNAPQSVGLDTEVKELMEGLNLYTPNVSRGGKTLLEAAKVDVILSYLLGQYGYGCATRGDEGRHPETSLQL